MRCRHVIHWWQRDALSGVVQRWLWTVSTNAVQLVNCSKSQDRKQQSSCDQWLWLSVARRVWRRRPTKYLDIHCTFHLLVTKSAEEVHVTLATYMAGSCSASSPDVTSWSTSLPLVSLRTWMNAFAIGLPMSSTTFPLIPICAYR